MALYLCVFTSDDKAGWEKGILYGEGQNLARLLMEGPANLITPTFFAEIGRASCTVNELLFTSGMCKVVFAYVHLSSPCYIMVSLSYIMVEISLCCPFLWV